MRNPARHAIVVAGICFDWVEVPISNIVLRGLTLKGSMSWTEGEYDSAFNIIRDRKIYVDPLLTCKMPLDDINEAFEKALRGEGGVILVEP